MELYNNYSAADFLDDDYFIQYIKYRKQEDVDKWNDWLSQSPPAAEAFREASASLSAILSAPRIIPEPQAVSVSWEIIERQTAEWDLRKKRWGRIRWAAAAAVACICLASTAYWYYNAQVSVTTGYAEQKEVVLPDESVVTLNANSSLTWYRAWSWRHQRQVWLKGEGMFKVKHLNEDTTHILPSERFTAFAGNLSIEVLGTTFDVKQRRNNVLVSLIAGKIRVIDRNKPAASQILDPGDAVSYTDTLSRLSRIVTLPDQPQAWMDHKIQANGMTVQDIIDNYEDTYGYKIILENPAQATKKIDGTLSLETEDGVLYMLANILNTNIHREGKNIYLQPK